MFVNNFNIFLILQMIPLLAYFIIFIVLKCYNRQKKKLE